jgi:hypothetical protein
MPNYQKFEERQTMQNWMTEYNSTYSARRSPVGQIGRPVCKAWKQIADVRDLPGNKQRCEVKRNSDNKRVYCQFDDRIVGVLDLPDDSVTTALKPEMVSSLVEPTGIVGDALDIMRMAQQQLQSSKLAAEANRAAGQTMKEAIDLSRQAADVIKQTKDEAAKAELYRQGGLAVHLLVNLIMQLADKKLPVEEREGLSEFRKIKAAANNAGVDVSQLGITDLLALFEIKKDPELNADFVQIKRRIVKRMSDIFQDTPENG